MTLKEELLKANKEVTASWLKAIGGPNLVKQVFKVYDKDLESMTPVAFCWRVVDNLVHLK